MMDDCDGLCIAVDYAGVLEWLLASAMIALLLPGAVSWSKGRSGP